MIYSKQPDVRVQSFELLAYKVSFEVEEMNPVKMMTSRPGVTYVMDHIRLRTVPFWTVRRMLQSEKSLISSSSPPGTIMLSMVGS